MLSRQKMQSTFLLVVFLLPLLTSALSYDKNGDYIIGAILPLTKDSGSGKCTTVNAEGVALTEAIDMALLRVAANNDFKTLLATKTIGYAIRDSCSDPVKEREIAYEFNRAALAYKTDKTKPKPVDIVISSFGVTSLGALNLLNVESIPQISYSKDNAKLLQSTEAQRVAVQNLISVYPENTMRIQVAVDLIKEFDFQYVYGVFSDDYQGKEASKLMASSLGSTKTCKETFVLDDNSVDSTVSSLKKNPLIKVVVVHCSKDIEKKLYQKLLDEGLDQFIVLSTQDWSKEESALQPFNSVLEGMIYVKQDKDARNFKSHMTGILRPYTKLPWVSALYESQGGTSGCLTARVKNSTTEKCFKAEEDVKIELTKAAGVAVYAFDAVFTIANGLLKGGNLLEAVKGLSFTVPFLPANTLKFNDYLIAEGTSFALYNVQKGNQQSLWVGSWEKIQNRVALRPNKADIRWKNGTKETPVSSCSETCALGQFREFEDEPLKCCWTCQRCPNGTFSNVTNADKCVTCGNGCALKPDQTGYVMYQLETFKWFEPLGSFLIFLMVIACCFILLALGIISQNSEHELIQLSGYNLLCLYLIGCLLLTLSPIPLLVTPSYDSCNGYIVLFNLALTIIFAVMMTRTSYVNSFYDEDGEVIKGGLGKYPRLVIIFVVVLVQAIILIVFNNIDPPLTLHSDTDVWYVKYAECSSWNSWGFWIAFSFNIALSLIGNFMSCSSTKMDDLCGELKWLLLTYLMFYINGMAEIIIFYRVKNQSLAVGQAVMCIVLALTFYFFFIWPKVWYVLFKSKDGKIQRGHQPVRQDDESAMITAIHSSDAFKHHGVVQMRLKHDDESSSA